MIALARVGTACGAFAGGPPWTVRTISVDGADDYRWSGSTEQIEVSAPDSNQGINLRQVAAAHATPTRDQTTCATWLGPVDRKAQPGLALRVREDDGRVRAITLTNNIWSAARQRWNVHLADSSAEDPMDQQADVSLPGFALVLADLPPPPWRLCARVRGTTFQAKVWVPARRTEPSWDDRAFAVSVALPPSWDFAGVPGLYVGHLSPGERTSFADWTTAG